MNTKEFEKLSDWIKTCYPREAILPTKAAMSIWYEELKDLSFEAAFAAVRQHTQTSKWSPTIADIRRLAAEISRPEGETADWGAGWEAVCKAISSCGYYREAEALERMDETTRQVVKRLGWKSLCESTSPGTDRANFRQIYEQVAQQRKETAVLSAELTARIAHTKQELTNGSQGLLITT